MLPKLLRFEMIHYPLWRRKYPGMLAPIIKPLLSQLYPVSADESAPETAQAMAHFLVDWDVIQGTDLHGLASALEAMTPHIESVDKSAPIVEYAGDPLRIPAQWEKNNRVLISWARMYPMLWPMHAQMVEAISAVAIVEILLPSEMWARAVAVYLQQRGKVRMENIRFLILRTDDIWIRDYGPIMAQTNQGQPVAINATYAVLPQYPQTDDNNMTLYWAAHHNIPVQALDLHTEGGNLWSDGQGTILMSSQVFYSNRYHTRDSLLAYLHNILDFEKAIITPRLTIEVTGHIDLMVKLIRDDAVFVSEASSRSAAEVLRKTRRLFERETNARGQRYQVIELPTPPLYINWFTHQIRRTYTNALTINGRVLVPTYGIPQDDIALRLYQQHMPDHEIIPVDSSAGINGGGSVHCMTKEIPMVT